MLTTVLLIVHILVALGIVGLVLIQHGKGADAGAAFGAGAAGGASGSVFGAQGSGNFLSRTTAILATIFFLTSLSLAYMSKSVNKVPTSIMDGTPVTTEVLGGGVTLPVPPSGDMPSDAPADLPTDAPVSATAAGAADDAPPAMDIPAMEGNAATTAPVQQPVLPMEAPPAKP